MEQETSDVLPLRLLQRTPFYLSRSFADAEQWTKKASRVNTLKVGLRKPLV